MYVCNYLFCFLCSLFFFLCKLGSFGKVCHKLIRLDIFDFIISDLHLLAGNSSGTTTNCFQVTELEQFSRASNYFRFGNQSFKFTIQKEGKRPNVCPFQVFVIFRSVVN
ncbi:hypothetical protein L6452_33518 [Arctium lappa]|uniref:Uncharacterized protein n=1 Tax=Arctium lappa TaxID=4217 RepID=A0ACB8YGA2_ARCLA|nr:hypothetical protein L6452_33518 [Arctium lappa]